MSSSSGTTGLRTPVSQIFGAGNDEIVIKVAQDYYKDDIRFTVSVDGKLVGGEFTVSSLNYSGQFDTLTLRGDWGNSAHKVEINYLNGYYNALTGEDSNLAIASATYNGADFLGGPKMLWSAGRYGFNTSPVNTVTGTSGVDKLIGGRGLDIVVGGRGDDSLAGGTGRDIFVENRGDGREVITDFTVAGKDADVIRLSGFMISSFSELAQRMSQSGKDVLVTLDVNNSIALKNVDMTKLTASNFEILDPVAKKAAVNLTAGTGKDALVLKLAQDYFAGADAQYTVSVDGKQVGGVFNASAVRLTGLSDTLTLRGDWGAGTHTVTVNFLNDSFDSLTYEDRNLFIQSATINGIAITDASKLVGRGSYSFSALVAAAAVVAPPPSEVVTATPTEIAKHEVFSFAKGDGAKTITGFGATGADADTLKIDGYGQLNLTSLAGVKSLLSFLDLQTLISQVGGDTVIKLSATDVVTLKNVSASSLTADNFSIVQKLEGAMQAATNNGWIVFNNTWGSGDFTYGKQYSVASSYDRDAMTTGTTFSWNYPATQQYAWTKVLAYPSIMFGYDTFDNVQGDFDPAHVLPVQVDDLKNFKTSFNVTQGGDTNGFDTSFDIWLTKKANGIWSDITNEVMIWLHRGEMSTYGNLVGTYSDGNYAAKIYHIDNYTALVPDKDYMAGTIDVKDVLAKLQALGIVSDQEYVNQIDLGTEPFRGSGWMTVNSLTYDVESVDGAGILTKSHADGGDTSVIKQGTAGADTISAGTAKIATLIGGAGNDTFVFKKGETGDVTIQDFHVLKTGIAEHDVLQFTGYGAGAKLVHGTGDDWSIQYSGGVEHFTLTGIQALTTNDYTFA